MKRLFLVPKTDTITICLPPDWVGKTVTCDLRHTEEEMASPVFLAAERDIQYKARKKKKTKVGRPKKSRRKRRTNGDQPQSNA